MIAETLRGLLEDAGIRIGGPNPWDIQVNDPRWYGRVIRDKNLGLGESYMDGWWDCERLDEMIYRLLRGGLKDCGIFLLHTIGANTTQTGCDPWSTRYIFPNGMLPSTAQDCPGCRRALCHRGLA